MPLRKPPPEDPAARKSWEETHDRCQCCGQPNWLTKGGVWPDIVTKYITGKIVDQPCNLIRACRWCEDKIKSGGLSLGNLLFLKGLADPDEFDAKQLRKIMNYRALPRELTPEYELDQLTQNHAPWMKHGLESKSAGPSDRRNGTATKGMGG